MKLPETPLEEIAKMLDYLVGVIEHELPSVDESDPAEASGAYYLRKNIESARAMSWQLRDASESNGLPQEPK